MRYLNKVVFIQSAHVPYAEINLDGNVHFIGTQGVGKTTLLRAILFFYNADKLKLGIQKEKKAFDAFYFEYPNGDKMCTVIVLFKVTNYIGKLRVSDNESTSLGFFPLTSLPALESRAEKIIRRILDKTIKL